MQLAMRLLIGSSLLIVLVICDHRHSVRNRRGMRAIQSHMLRSKRQATSGGQQESCGQAIVPREFQGGLKFGEPTVVDFGVGGQNKDGDTYGTDFAGEFGKQKGGSVGGALGDKLVDIPCQASDGATQDQQQGSSASQQSQPQPQEKKPCPVALVNRQIQGGLKFGNPVNVGWDLGAEGKEGAVGNSFQGTFGKQKGGSFQGALAPALESLCPEDGGEAAPQNTEGNGGTTQDGSGSMQSAAGQSSDSAVRKNNAAPQLDPQNNPAVEQRDSSSSNGGRRRMLCRDLLPSCKVIIANNPTVCEKNIDYMKKRCGTSCGFC